MKSGYFLMPPSEGKAEGGKGSWRADSGKFGDLLGEARLEIAERLQKFVRNASRPDLTKFFGVSGAHLDRAVALAEGGFVGTPTLMARDRYNGVVFSHLDMASLDPSSRRWCTSRVVVVSGLLGLVAAGDPVPDYRLKMGARLAEIGGLAQWWKPRLLAAAQELMSKAVLINALPMEHGGALDSVAAARRTVAVKFVSLSGANAAGHAAKAAKGLLVRQLVLQRDCDVLTVCEGFAGGGFVFHSHDRIGRTQHHRVNFVAV